MDGVVMVDAKARKQFEETIDALKGVIRDDVEDNGEEDEKEDEIESR